MPFNVRTAFLDDDEADRLYREYPHIGKSAESYCPTCHKSGQFLWKGQAYLCPCDHQLQLYKLYLSSGIGARYHRLRWEDYHGDPEIVDRLKKFVVDHEHHITMGEGLFFQGPLGTGKTMLATLVLKEFLKKGYSVYAKTFEQALRMFTAGWYSEDDRKYFHKKFVTSQVLLLDEIGREHKTKLTEATFDSILRTRVHESRPTFITTNMTIEDMESTYGSSALSLLKECSLYHLFDGADFRPQAHERNQEEKLAGETRPIF